VPKEVVVAGSKKAGDTSAFIREINRLYQPHMVLGLAEPKARKAMKTLPFLRDRPLRDGKIAAYVCEHYACLPPVTDPAVVAGVIARGSGVRWSEF
jgi:uncharacterized protein YyaL (SSP411 family)